MNLDFFKLAALVAFASCTSGNSLVNPISPPAYPLVSIDPYTSAWSMTDKLNESSVKHWTGKDFPLIGKITVDGTTYRFMGGAEESDYRYLAPGAETGAWPAKYVFSEPKGDWTSLKFNDSSWKEGKGGFGTIDNYLVNTEWSGREVWVRRSVDLESLAGKKVSMVFSNDDGCQIYFNGVKVLDTGKRCNSGRIVELDHEMLAALKDGSNIIALHCENTGGPAVLDFGLFVEEPKIEDNNLLAVQNSVNVLPTRTLYDFTCGPVSLELTFMAPLLLDNLDLVSRPVNYISYNIKSNDGKDHEVAISLEASPAWALNTPMQNSVCETVESRGMVFVKAGSEKQAILAKKGDDIRIDWGYFYLGGEKAEGTTTAAVDGKRLQVDRALGSVKKSSGKFLIGYDDIYSIQYFGDNLRPYWNRGEDKTIFDEFEAAIADYPGLVKRCARFDAALMKDAKAAGGERYASLLALAYRQAIHAHKLVQAPNGDLLFFSKENNSNGSIGTVDITYPTAPIFLLYNPELAKATMNHIFYYSESGKWAKPFAAHDVGTYPIANGQTYGGDMPVEECGNMIITTAAVCRYTNSAEYAKKHWEILTTWVDYLLRFGLDPENQLCTDDFAGHFAHNANLSIKAIIGIASYGYMAGLQGMEETKEKYISAAKEMAAEWVEKANDGDHYRLTFDAKGSWSQKYNLVWDDLLDLDVFPDSVAEKEIAYYLTKQNTWGLPLDSRKTYTKTDWILWTATMAKNQADFHAIVEPVYKFYDETEDRVPMSDWVFTDNPVHRSFKARSVVGGLFIKLMAEKRK